MSRWSAEHGGGAGDDLPALVRPYALVRGRTRTDAADLPVEAILATTELGARSDRGFEEGEILLRCVDPCGVAELAAHLQVPLGVVRVLVGDLMREGMLHLHTLDVDLDGAVERGLLERVLAGLEAL